MTIGPRPVMLSPSGRLPGGEHVAHIAHTDRSARRSNGVENSSTEISRRRDDLLASVLHDLQQPLAIVLGRTHLLQRRLLNGSPPGEDAILSCLGDIEASAVRMAAEIADALDIGLASSQRPEATRRPVDLVALIGRAVADQQRTSSAQSIGFACAHAELIATVDAASVRRMLGNLLSNATKYSPAGSGVIVTLERQDGPGGDAAVLAVRDEGIGIPEADLPRVTEPFFRASNVAGVAGGSGIGLTGARRTIEEHGGSLHVESREGAGTAVTVTLPLELTSARVDPPTRPAVADMLGRRHPGLARVHDFTMPVAPSSGTR